MAQFKVKKFPLFIVGLIVAGIFGLRFAYSNGYLKKSAVATADSAEVGVPEAGAAPMQPVANAAIRFCGSNTIGAELAPALAAEFLKSKGASGINVGKT